MWPNPQETTYLVAYTENAVNGKPHFSFSSAGENQRENNTMQIHQRKIECSVDVGYFSSAYLLFDAVA